MLMSMETILRLAGRGLGSRPRLEDMKKNTEIKIEMDESGSWTATSPDYPGWKAEGKESFACGVDAAKSLEMWVKEQ